MAQLAQTTTLRRTNSTREKEFDSEALELAQRVTARLTQPKAKAVEAQAVQDDEYLPQDIVVKPKRRFKNN